MSADPLAPAEDDPLDGVANFFDLGIVFSLGFLLALVGATRSGAPPTGSSGAAVPQQREASPHLRSSGEEQGGQGRRLGIAYRLESGEVVFVPDPAPAP